MPKTILSDLMEALPQSAPYVNQRILESCAFVRSGIMTRSAQFDALARGGGRTTNMPFWRRLAANRQIVSDRVPLTVDRITAGQDVAAIHNDGNGWSVNQLAGIVSVTDPLRGVTHQLGDYWTLINGSMLISTLNGVFASETMASNRLKIAKEALADYPADKSNFLNASTFIDGTVLLGDRSAELQYVAMHSITEARLRKLDLIDTIPASDGKAVIKMFQGRIVIIDDRLPIRAGATDGQVFATYLFGLGAIAYGEADLSGIPAEGGHGNYQLEYQRDAAAGDTNIFYRRRLILHPRGVAWQPGEEMLLKPSPDLEDLENGAYWRRVWDPKDIRIVQLLHN